VKKKKKERKFSKERKGEERNLSLGYPIIALDSYFALWILECGNEGEKEKGGKKGERGEGEKREKREGRQEKGKKLRFADLG